jgi:hypothetical protein
LGEQRAELATPVEVVVASSRRRFDALHGHPKIHKRPTAKQKMLIGATASYPLREK